MQRDARGSSLNQRHVMQHAHASSCFLCWLVRQAIARDKSGGGV